jgi:hypothetical protein
MSTSGIKHITKRNGKVRKKTTETRYLTLEIKTSTSRVKHIAIEAKKIE